MQPLIDGDILLHEIGWSCEFKDKESKENILLDTEHARELLTKKIEGICTDVEATKPPIIFLSDSQWLSGKLNRVFIPGFRYDVAKTVPYKGNRTNPKPFHFYNILSMLLFDYETKISSKGLEADDEMCRFQYESADPTIICSRDKDVRICPGWHFSWECGAQRAIWPTETDVAGFLTKKENGDVLGYGTAFFYYQMLVGDSADHIPGLKSFGPVKAFQILSETKSTEDQYKIVRDLYKEQIGDGAKEYFMEQAKLLWMQYNKEDNYEFKRR